MKFTLLRYGHDATELHMKEVDRIVAEDDVLKIYYHSGQMIIGYMIKVEEK